MIGSFETLTDFLNSKDLKFKEGFSAQVPGEVKLLEDLANNKDITSIMEIGFHAGHSSETFLKTNMTAHVTSFDIGSYSYVKLGKQYIDNTFPTRHELLLGNSLTTVPEYTASHPDKKFDLIFIDGGHTYDVAKTDIMNCKKLAHKDTIVIMDDTITDPTFVCHWNKGPSQSWTEAVNWGMIREEGHFDFCKGRGASWGYYNV